MSERSQLHRMEAILMKYGIWKPGEKVTQSNKAVTSNYDAEQLRNVVEYFIDRKNTEAMQPVYAANIKDIVKYTYRGVSSGHTNEWEASNTLKDSLIHILCTNQKNGMTRYRNSLSYTADIQTGVNVAGYSKAFIIGFPTYPEDKKQWIFLSPTDSVQVSLTEQDSSTYMNFIRNGKTVDTICLNTLVRSLRAKDKQGDLPAQELTIDGTGDIKPRIIFKSIDIKHPESVENDEKIVSGVEVWILVK